MGEVSPSRYTTSVSWSEVPHLSDKTRIELLASTPPWLREARSEGIPSLGAGAIFPIPQSEILVDPFPIPAYFPRAYGLDVGWKATAAVWGARDPSDGVIYLYAEYKRGRAEPSVHGTAIKMRGDWIPGVIDPAAHSSSQKDGEELLALYREPPISLKLRPADHSVEAGLHETWELLATGRLKVFRTLMAWREEYRNYHRDENGKIVKENDHCLHPDTLIITRRGRKRIQDLVGTEGEVLTIGGRWTPYRHCRLTARNQPTVRVIFEDGSAAVCTPDHRFLTAEGWTEARDMAGRICYDAIASSIHGNPCAPPSFPTPSRSSLGSAITSAASISRGMAFACIVGFGKKRMAGLCRLASTFITTTRIAPTTGLRTSFSSRAANTSPTTSAGMAGAFLRRLLKRLGRGMALKRASAGTASTMSARAERCISAAHSAARSAARSLMPASLAPIGSVPTPANRIGAARLGSTMLIAPAVNAERSSASIAIAQRGPVAAHVGPRCLRVVAAAPSDVYCLEVPETHAFAVANGVIVHNCMDATRYFVKSGRDRMIVKPMLLQGGVAGRGDPRVGY